MSRDRNHKRVIVAWTEKDHKPNTHLMHVDSNTRIYHVVDTKRKSWVDIGYIVNGVFNCYSTVGLQVHDTKDIIPVIGHIFKYRKELKIKRLRREFTERLNSKVGALTITKYGYISRDKMAMLLKKRKYVREKGRELSVLYTKKKDWEMHSK